MTAGHPLGPLAPLAETDQWVTVRLEPLPDGKTKKTPTSYVTGITASSLESSNWTTYEAAQAVAAARGPGHTVGFVLTAADDWACVDIDGAATPTGWSETAQRIAAALPGAVAEVSQSGKGLHLWCRYANPPAHSSKRTDLHIEAYTSLRFIAIGTGQTGTLADRCDALPAFLAEWFPLKAAACAEVPNDGPCDGWDGHADDDELIEAARRARTTAQRFTGEGDDIGLTFSDLWDCNVSALARRWPSTTGDEFDRSSADDSLACRLAFWTGRDVGRCERLMRRSSLTREKWDDRSAYLVDTIRKACAKTTGVYTRRKPVAAPPAPGASADHIYIVKADPFHAAGAMLTRDHAHPEGHRLKFWQDVFYRWDGAGWGELTTGDIRAMLYAFLQRDGFADYKPTQATVGNLLDALKAAAHLESRRAPPCWTDGRAGPTPWEMVACKNGLLHLPTRTLHPPTPAFFSFNAAPYAYQPDAPPPAQWLAFLGQVWPGDAESIATLQELFGYLLTPDTSQQKIFLIVGPKRSGKGTIGRVLSRMLGDENVTSPSLTSLAGDFGLQPLIGKLAAIFSDARLGGRDTKVVSENLLRISGEDRVSVNRKNISAITVALSARLVMLTNELPRLADASGAMASRFIILRMRQSFYGKEDPGLTGRLLDELPAILNWSIEGWQRLKQRGYFVTPKSSADEMQELADLGSPVLAFVREVCDISPVAEIETDLLYSAWRVWCNDQRQERVAPKNTFMADLTSAVEGLTRRQPRVGASRWPTYRGIGVRPGWHGLARAQVELSAARGTFPGASTN